MRWIVLVFVCVWQVGATKLKSLAQFNLWDHLQTWVPIIWFTRILPVLKLKVLCMGLPDSLRKSRTQSLWDYYSGFPISLLPSLLQECSGMMGKWFTWLRAAKRSLGLWIPVEFSGSCFDGPGSFRDCLCSHHGSLWALWSSIFHLLLSPSFVLRPGPQLSMTQQASL